MAITASIMDATATITPTRRRDRAGLVLAGLLGLVLLGAGGVSLGSAVTALPARAVLGDLRAGRPVADAEAQAAAAALDRAGRWQASAELAADRGLLLLRRDDAEAERATEAALRLGPVQPSAWARLAALRAARGEAEGAVQALRLSMLTGAVVPELTRSRIELGLALADRLDPATRALLVRQFRLAWVLDPAAASELLRRADAAPFMQEAMAAMDAADIAQFVRLHGRP